MDNTILVGLFFNVSLLLTLALMYTVFQSEPKNFTRKDKVVLGVLIGIAGIFIISFAVQLPGGAIFDTRSILISVTGLFFGVIPTVLAGSMMIVYRIIIGGSGMWMGVLSILVTGAIGVVWKKYRLEKILEQGGYRRVEFYFFGVVSQIGMLLCTIALPKEQAPVVFQSIALPVLLLYPVGTYLLCNLLKNQHLKHQYLVDIKESGERINKIIEGTKAGTWEWNVPTGEQVINDRWAEIIGYTVEELSPVSVETWKHLCHPEDLAKSEEILSEVFARRKEYYELDFRMKHKNGDWVWVISRGKVNSWTPDGKPLLISGTHYDINKNKLLEEEINEKRAQLFDIIEFLPDATLAIDKDRKVIIWNKAIEEMTGIPSNEMMGMGDYAYSVPFYGCARPSLMDLVLEENPLLEEGYKDIHRIGNTIEAEAYVPAIYDNKGAWLFLKVSPLHNQKGETIGVIESIRDISLKKQVENELLAKDQRLIEAQRIGHFGNWEYNLVDKTFWGSSEAFEIIGIEREEGQIVYRELNDYLKQDAKHSLRNAIEVMIQTEDNEEIEFKYLRQNDEKERTLYAKSRVELDKNGKPAKLLGILQDITEKYETQQELKKSEERFRIIFEEAPLGIGLFDLYSGKATQVNKKFMEIIGRTREEMNDFDWMSVSHPEDMEQNIRYREQIFAGEINGFSMKKRYFKKDGSVFWINLTIALLDSIAEKNPREICMIEDITEKVKREEEVNYLNCHDVLTGLYNRMFFEEEKRRLDVERQLPLSVIIGDVDGLKLINDGFGYTSGDQLLIEAGKILKQGCREEDVISRIGGDEFCILLPQTTGEQAREIGRRIQKLCEHSALEVGTGAIKVSISVGYDTKTRMDESLSSVIVNAENAMRRRKLLERKSVRSDLMASINATMLEKSHETAEHADRLVRHSRAIGERLNFTENMLFDLELATTLHDIGKMSVEQRILMKSEKLTEEEWAEIKKHPEAGYRIAQATTELMPIAEYILSHHERWDGNGYPQGLQREEIPMISRIINLVDSFDAMTSQRPYGKTLNTEEAIEEMERCAGSQFDPELTRIYIDEILKKDMDEMGKKEKE